jgi:hypothetical protein
MSELDLLRELGAAVPAPDADALGRGRARLLDAIAQAGQRSRGRWRPPIRPLYAAAVLGVAAVVVGDILGILPRGNPAEPVRAHVAVTPTADVLGQAAAAVESQPSVRPAADRWIYSVAVDQQLGQPPQTSEEWMRFDGSQDAYIQDGQLITHQSPTVPPSTGSPLDRYLQDITPMTAYDALASLPQDPAGLLAAVDRATGPSFQTAGLFGAATTHNPAANEFQFLAQLLWEASAAAPASAEAAVFRALATVQGVTVQRGVTDAAGDATIALSGDGGVYQLLLDPTTYATLGLRVVSSGSAPLLPVPAEKSAAPKAPPAGTIVDSQAWSTVRLVNHPGQR